MAEHRDVPPQLLEAIENLSRFHRQHEEFYSQAPLQQAREVQAASRALKELAAQWSEAEPSEHPAPSPFAGAEDLNPPGLVGESGILFMEGEGEPAEIAQLKREVEALAAGCEQTGEWLADAMEQAWAVAGSLVQFVAGTRSRAAPCRCGRPRAGGCGGLSSASPRGRRTAPGGQGRPR